MMRILTLGVLVALNATAAVGTRCGGGDGPKPLADISHTFEADIKGVPTLGDVQEFLFSERDNAILYRNERNEVLKTNVPAGPSLKLTESGLPLSRLTSYRERYIAAEAAPWVFDRKQQRWYSYKLDARPFRHLFFDGDSLYSISSKYDEQNNQTFTVYRYDVGNASAIQTCFSLQSPPGQHLTLAEGHKFPWAYLYRTDGPATSKFISFFALNVSSNCKVQPLDGYTREISGPVKRAHVFPEIGNKTFAVEVDHPTHNLLWEHNGCRYFHTDGEALVLSYRQPIIATWSDQKGMSLIYLDRESQAHLPPLPSGRLARGLLPEDVWLADDAQRLFLAPRYDYGARWLLQMTLSDKF